MRKDFLRDSEDLTPLMLMKSTKQAIDNQETDYVIASVSEFSKAQVIIIYSQNVGEPITYAHFKAILQEIERRHQNNEYCDRAIPWSDYLPTPQEKHKIEFEAITDIHDLLTDIRG